MAVRQVEKILSHIYSHARKKQSKNLQRLATVFTLHWEDLILRGNVEQPALRRHQLIWLNKSVKDFILYFFSGA
ncbi:hypothetical protein Q8A67_009122 [Cirrhinus molitorella]|uniref:Uncharacterized protein n=1 Tax=Cirrhinus molitorella TaxID=172907 RepID=A0AA88PVQ0_9TELE|nr:hypothetical protein Q8A67_009122 [Cirrhinus molitorella]